MAEQILRINQDTILKLRPEQASSLAPQEIYSVAAGTVFKIQSYAYADINGSFQGHVKFALKETAIRGLNTWFVYSLHMQIEQDGQVVYPQEDQISLPILRITRDTILKRRPLPSSMLAGSESSAIVAGQSIELQSYAYADAQGDFSSHIKFAIRSRTDFVRGLSTWFVYDQHAFVEYDDKIVYPPEDPNTPLMEVLQTTLFKRRPVAADQLTETERFSAAKGSIWKLFAYALTDGAANSQSNFNGHLKFTLKYEQDYIQKLSTWYVVAQHVQIERNGVRVYPSTPSPSPVPSPVPVPTPSPQPSPQSSPQPSPQPSPVPPYRGTAFRLPGSNSIFYTDQPIIPGGNFTWGEATKDATRIPESVTIVNNIIALARELQKARNQIGRPFIINSWYRPPAINQAVGGVSNSQHLTGKAVDVQIPGYSGRRTANALMLWWSGGVGIYSTIPDIVHLDIGPKRTWGF
jgi:hypothetical protein